MQTYLFNKFNLCSKYLNASLYVSELLMRFGPGSVNGNNLKLFDNAEIINVFVAVATLCENFIADDKRFGDVTTLKLM